MSTTANYVRRGLAAFGISAAPAFVAAQEVEAPALQPPVGAADILSVGGSLALVIAAIMLCGWLYSRGQNLRVRGGGIINIVANQPLGPKERILLIEVAGKQLIVGVTASQVSKLHVFDGPVLHQPLRPQAGGSFGDRMKSILRSERK